MPVILARGGDQREPIAPIGRGAAPETALCGGVKIPLKPRERALRGAGGPGVNVGDDYFG
ncbi:hypothetical protein HNR23_002812 [Nocardiopsis mwathae]|uniref:Uncharacterized protein n=1 Tax=Nocardiopsis mwathae TaxID=1472723 RepID=A0A7W9YIG4_9ACTN|nr:hypothetical protein [Nocardiopsis mwathae]MBB6172752.1 hypothetical protein [Nocardiopsis mwathae]